ncbi:uracil-DNA glycosylase [Amycolatopsis vancoresmycina DSM 44592]|uniref:Uracil-DNA glycosylase n=1 Tax=Amycolatopsis vancoresmycina DSM 44592 TaxID=1292037 RepID=R1GD82_9PSEU|nr:uracil-DNA glycosylase [Amycolatopsis vancoresmycina DSM 44592]
MSPGCSPTTRTFAPAVPSPNTVCVKVLVVGEQPGDKEDLAGEPFVGPAGMLLDRAFAEAGFREGAVQELPGWPDERLAREVLLVTRLLADDEDLRAGRPFAEHGLRGVLVQRAAVAAGRHRPQAVQIGGVRRLGTAGIGHVPGNFPSGTRVNAPGPGSRRDTGGAKGVHDDHRTRHHDVGRDLRPGVGHRARRRGHHGGEGRRRPPDLR